MTGLLMTVMLSTLNTSCTLVYVSDNTAQLSIPSPTITHRQGLQRPCE